MRHPRGGRLQLPDRRRRAAFGVALERLAAGLHQDHDEARERLAESSAATMASVATRSAAKRPATTPRSVRQTTGAPVTASPTSQTSPASRGRERESERRAR